ncbi:MAG: 2-C-methyl-D-erythritol 4-phosphate cytidylyltransferase [Gammaproteobacteria bacterium]|nr:2-C-methyl-D-erythritol 4-phosphate cytidylyltransferase [Gammaproteobacteria bacterium]
MSHYWAVVPAAGVGSRMRADRPKQYLELSGKTILQHTLERLATHPQIKGVVVAVSAGDAYWPTLKLDTRLPIFVADGGDERCHSVLKGLKKLATQAKATDWVLVHDAARPCLQHQDIDKLISELNNTDGGLLGLPVADTIKFCDKKNKVQRTVDRSGLWRALTPQMFRLGQLLDALQQAIDDNALVTDEASAMERIGIQPVMVEGQADNIKITHPQDLRWAEMYLNNQRGV